MVPLKRACRNSLAEAQTVAKANAGEAQSLFVIAQNSRDLASDKIKIAAESAGIDPTELSEDQIIASLQGKIIALEGANNLSESASLLLKISKSSLESSSQLLKSADANLVAANKSVENANAQAALAEGVEDDLENLLAQAEAAAIAQADDDAEASAVNAENSFAVAADAARSVFTDVSTALDASETAFDAAFKFETTQGGSSVDALSTVKDAVSSLQDQISAVLSKNIITGEDGTAVSQGLDNLVSSVEDVINDLNQEFLISLSKELTTENIITVSIKGAAQDTSASVTFEINDDNIPTSDAALESMRDGLVDLINKKPEFDDVITVESGFGIGDILITSKSKTDDLFEISVSEEANSKDLSIINASSSGIEGAIRAVNEGLTGLSDVASTIQSAVSDAETSSVTARLLADQIDKDSDPQPLTSAEAQENLATIQAQEVIAKSASDLSFAQQFVGTASLAQVQSGEGQLLQNVEKFSQEKALFDAREAANAAPVSGDDSVKLVEDTSFTFSVLDNDKRADGDDLERATLLSVGTPSNGSIKILSQKDEVDFSEVSLSGGDRVRLNVNGISVETTFSNKDKLVEDLTDAANGNALVSEFVTVTGSGQKILIEADKAGDGQEISLKKINSNNEVSDIAVSSIIKNGSLIYTPNANFNGNDSFIYTITNNFEVESFSSASVAIEITPDNDAPVASRDFKTTADDDEIVSLDLVSNDADIDGDQLSVLQINGVDVANVDTISLSSGAKIRITKSDNGEVNEIKFDPSGAFNALSVGQEVVETFEYTVTDGNIGEDDTQKAELTSVAKADNGKQIDKLVISGVVDKGDSYFVSVEGVEVFYQAIDGDGISDVVTSLIEIINNNGDLKQNITAKIGNNSSEIVLEGTINGKSLNVSTRANNAGTDTQVVEITVTGSNDAPVAKEASFSVNEDGELIGSLDAVDPDDGDTINIEIAAGGDPASGAVEILAPDNDNPKFRFKYTPNADFFGTDSFEFRVEDSFGATSTAKLI